MTTNPPPGSSNSIGNIGNISVGDNASGQVVIGQENTVSQANTTLTNSQNTVAAPNTAADLATLRQMFATLKTQVSEAAPADKQDAALERVTELEEAITADKPDLTTMDYVKRWFSKNIPAVAGAVTSVVIHPIVGKLVETAGEMAADEFRDRFK